MIIDGHIHVGGWNYPHYASQRVTIGHLNRLLDACEIAGAVLLPTDQKDNEGLLTAIREEGKKKYWFFPWIDPRSAGWRDFLEKHLSRIHGIKVHASLDSVVGGITHSLYAPLLSFIRDHQLPLLVHCGRRQDTASYIYVIEAAKKYPDATFIMCHLGGDHEQLKLQSPLDVKHAGLKNIYFDISATREFWTIQQGIAVLGAERFIFASDYPVMHPKASIETIRALELPERERRLIFGENILKILEKR